MISPALPTNAPAQSPSRRWTAPRTSGGRRRWSVLSPGWWGTVPRTWPSSGWCPGRRRRPYQGRIQVGGGQVQEHLSREEPCRGGWVSEAGGGGELYLRPYPWPSPSWWWTGTRTIVLRGTQWSSYYRQVLPVHLVLVHLQKPQLGPSPPSPPASTSLAATPPISITGAPLAHLRLEQSCPAVQSLLPQHLLPQPLLLVLAPLAGPPHGSSANSLKQVQV